MEFPNLCVIGDMSTCKGNNWSSQVACRFSEKASNGNRCMYYVFDEFCSCLKAQIDCVTPLADKVETKPMEEIIQDLKDSVVNETPIDTFVMPIIVGS